MDKKVKRRKVSFINQLRKAFVLSDTYEMVVESARSEVVGPKGGARYDCSICGATVAKKDLEVDHYIEPLTPYHLYQYQMTEKQVLTRLFCDISNLRCVCKPCHSKHSKDQMKLRREAKKKNKSLTDK